MGGMVTVPCFQLMIGFVASSQGCPRMVFLLRRLRNLIPSSAHSSVVRGHIEFPGLGATTSVDKKSVRLKSHLEFQDRD